MLTPLPPLVAGSGCSRLAAPAQGQSIDRLLAEWNRPDAPGCTVGVRRNGALVYEHGYGLASLEVRAPLTPASVLNAASITKQFTAYSVLLLAHRGRLSLDDDVSRYVPGWEDHGATITIRHLLSHTSGLRDAFMLQGLRPEHADNVNQQIVSILAHARGLNFAPGTQFEYNNGAYTLLAAIVARVNGRTFPQFAQENIFAPLGMHHSYVRDDPTRVVADAATSYTHTGDGFRIALHTMTNAVVGNDGLFTTVGDLLQWEEHLAAPGNEDAAVIREMETPLIATGWSAASRYGFALEIADDRGLRTIGHSGGDEGVRAYVVRYPQRGLSIAILCNRDDVDPVGLTRQVADVVLDRQSPARVSAPPPSPPVTAVSLPAHDLQERTGIYRDADGSIGRIFIRDGTLVASAADGSEYQLTPVSPTRFVIAGTSVVAEFVPAANGRPQELHVSGAGPAVRVSTQVPPFRPSPAELQAFAGTYTSDEIDGTYMIAADAAALVLRVATREDAVLEPLVTDEFSNRTLGVVRFSRDIAGRVTGFTVTSGGIRGLRFTRLAVRSP